MHTTLVFDIETVPDAAGLRRLYELDAALADADVVEIAFQRRRAASGNDFLPLHLQRVAAISCVLREGSGLRVWSLGAAAEPEGALIQRFYDGIEKYTPQLVSWNGGGFDLPVLHYRALHAGVQAARYWETGDSDPAFRWNNYLNRFHWRHVDLMDVLSGGQVRARASLTDMAHLLGLPGKLGFSGAEVWDAWLAGRIVDIRRYCETDVLNTLLVYLRFEHMRGRLTREALAAEEQRVRALLAESTEPHHREFLEAWSVA